MANISCCWFCNPVLEGKDKEKAHLRIHSTWVLGVATQDAGSIISCSAKPYLEQYETVSKVATHECRTLEQGANALEQVSFIICYKAFTLSLRLTYLSMINNQRLTQILCKHFAKIPLFCSFNDNFVGVTTGFQ